jgi:hypothetical protein
MLTGVCPMGHQSGGDPGGGGGHKLEVTVSTYTVTSHF